EFLAANVSDETPFIVMPYMENGNARDYLKSHRKCDRVKLLRDASLGLSYIHESRIVHADIKAVNILIDDAGRAVITDFGISRVESDITSTRHTGSRNWMAPELFNGKVPDLRCDVYSFGITIYEVVSFILFVLTGKMPFGDLLEDDKFLAAVVGRDVRPPVSLDPPEGDKVWDLAEDCWSGSATKRPTAGVICERLE
ncbi:kinase-like protein, partial [Athelia psychrophila]